MNRSDIEVVLASLKPFQRRTVDHAFDRLFLAKDSTSRFLVADEVGLGKTLVARGLIARTIEHLWDTAKRIDIVYICSNGSIARANLPKLHVGATSDRSFALATRLTMLATELAPRAGRLGLAASKVNFVSFTPGTSFDMGKATGQSEERVVLFRLLEPVVKARTGLMNLLQAGISNRDNWRWRLKNSDIALDPSIGPAVAVAVLAGLPLHRGACALRALRRDAPSPREARARAERADDEPDDDVARGGHLSPRSRRGRWGDACRRALRGGPRPIRPG